MLRRQDITVGKYYVNISRRIAREVVQADENTVVFDTYHLNTGNSCGSPSECTKHDFVHWADREATDAESASLRYTKTDAQLYAPQITNEDELQLV
jgi:hypothetical protein